MSLYKEKSRNFAPDMKNVCDLIARWIGLMVFLVAVVAMYVPALFAWIDTKSINPLLGVIMFGMGLTLSPKDFQIVLSRPKDILIGCMAQFKKAEEEWEALI